MPHKLMAVPASSDSIVLVDYMGGPNVFANLFRVTEDGTEVWRATPPGSGPNAWASARLDGGEVSTSCGSWSTATGRR